MLNFQGAVHQDSVLLTHAPPLGWVSFPRKTWVSFNYKSILAIALDYSPVYICDIEKGRKPVPDEILEQLPRLLLLDEAETNEMYDLAAKSRNTISADLPDYIMKKDIVRAALRTAKKHNVTDKQWEDFIRRITKDKE